MEILEKYLTYSKLTMKIPERCDLGHSGILIINFELFQSFPSFPIVDFEQVNICSEHYLRFYSFDIYLNVSTGGRQDLARNNAGNPVIFLISRTQ